MFRSMSKDNSNIESCIALSYIPIKNNYLNISLNMLNIPLEGIDCLSTIKIGDGRELFKIDNFGYIKSLIGDLCIDNENGSLDENTNIVLNDCNKCIGDRCKFELYENRIRLKYNKE